MTHQSEQPWHARSIEEIEPALGASPRGLSASGISDRLERFGRNTLPEAPRPGVMTAIMHQFESPLVLILIVASVVTIALKEYFDATAITAVLLLNATIGFAQERRAEHSVRALMGLLTQRARVVRDGEECEIESAEIVPGDLIVLESGVRVPADLRLVVARSFFTDESLLTGESTTIPKTTSVLPANLPVADRANMAYAGTMVSSGRGRGYVVATGTGTEIGAIATEMRAIERAPTPLEQRVARFARFIGIVVAVAAAGAFAAGVAIGEPPAEMFTTAVALAVATVPEGLPVALTITMVVGVRRMARHNVIVRWLPSVETLGSTTVIGSDKTGTLTLNQMAVQELWTAAGSIDLTTPAKTAAEELGEAARLTLLAGILANEAEIVRQQGEYEIRGDPTEAALLTAAIQCGLAPDHIRLSFKPYADIPFESERQFSASVREHDDGYVTFVKGAPERMLAMATTMLTPAGLVEIDHGKVHDVANTMAARGLRVLAMAYLPAHARPPTPHALPDPEGLVLLGLQGMADPIRPGAREAIAACRTAGIRVVMITGDHAVTARAVAAELGICAASDPVLTGSEMSALGEGQFRRAVESVSVYARVAPEQKLAIVRALRDRGDVVAITGDGVNDAPALKAAHIGIAMGRRGTDVAKEAADMVLVDDNFVSIAAAIEEGRTTLANVRNATFFLLSTNGGELLIILFALGFRRELPLLAIHILWINLVTDSVQVIGLSFEPGSADTMRQPPRPLDEGLLPRILWERIGLSSVVMTAATLSLFWWEREHGSSLEAARSVALTTMILFQFFQVANARSASRSFLQINPLSNPILLSASLGALLIHVLALYLPPMQYVLRIEPIDLDAWLRSLACAATILVAVELHKYVRNRTTRTSAGS